MKRILSFVLVLMFAVSITACSKKGTAAPTAETNGASVADKETAEVFSSSIDEIVAYAGEGKAEKNEASQNKLTGLAVIRIIDFTGDNKPELVTVYSDEFDSEIYWMEISGFDYATASLKFSDDSTKLMITSKSSEEASGPCIWFYTDERGDNYFVVGDDLSKSADFYRYVQMDGGEKCYKFMKDFTVEGGNFPEGTYDKIEFVGMSDEDVEKNFEKNQQAIDAINSKK